MSGRQHVMVSTGSNYEKFVDLLLGRIASMVSVPREEDFGIDFYFQPRIPSGPHTETVAELGSLQVKGGDEGLAYGGLNAKGEWKQYEFMWLRSLATPLYLARVDAGCHAIAFFSLWQLWLIFLRHTAFPFEVVFTTQQETAEPYTWQKPLASRHPSGAGHGDGMRGKVDLGPPILRLTQEKLEDAVFRQQTVNVLRTWITRDRLTLMRHHQSIPVLEGITRWRTDYLDGINVTTWQVWDHQPGANIAHLCKTVGPILTNLGAHLQWQDNWGAYKLIPILEWIDEQGLLDSMGRGLLEGLRETQARGVGPREVVPESHRQSP